MKVFINCPLDAKYTSLFRPMIFTLIYLGLEPRTAIKDTDCLTNRLDKILELIKESDISIHDLSRIKSAGSDEYYRLNMPFELGIDYSYSLLTRREIKKFVVLEEEKYSYLKGLSDYAGFDILTHDGNPVRMVKVLRDWFVNNKIVTDVKGGATIWYEYTECWAYIYDKLIEKGYSHEETDEIPYNEYEDFVKEWLKTKAK